jgi:hypothetical protein
LGGGSRFGGLPVSNDRPQASSEDERFEIFARLFLLRLDFFGGLHALQLCFDVIQHFAPRQVLVHGGAFRFEVSRPWSLAEFHYTGTDNLPGLLWC